MSFCVCDPGDNCSPVPVPANGDRGDCPLTVRHGTTCTFSCDENYTESGVTSCDAGVLTLSFCLGKIAAGCFDVSVLVCFGLFWVWRVFD